MSCIYHVVNLSFSLVQQKQVVPPQLHKMHDDWKKTAEKIRGMQRDSTVSNISPGIFLLSSKIFPILYNVIEILKKLDIFNLFFHTLILTESNHVFYGLCF